MATPHEASGRPDAESAVLVHVPEAEPVVGELRAALDPSARWGVPAHVTVLYPFLPPAGILDCDVDRLAKAVRAVPRFRVEFRRVAWFGEQVVWLAPEPDDGFRRLTAAVWSAFPGHPPYEGAYVDVVPHLTVGDRADAGRMREAAAVAARGLPIRVAVRAAQLWYGRAAPGAWHRVRDLPLG